MLLAESCDMDTRNLNGGRLASEPPLIMRPTSPATRRAYSGTATDTYAELQHGPVSPTRGRCANSLNTWSSAVLQARMHTQHASSMAAAGLASSVSICSSPELLARLALEVPAAAIAAS